MKTRLVTRTTQSARLDSSFPILKVYRATLSSFLIFQTDFVLLLFQNEETSEKMRKRTGTSLKMISKQLVTQEVFEK